MRYKKSGRLMEDGTEPACAEDAPGKKKAAKREPAAGSSLEAMVRIRLSVALQRSQVILMPQDTLRVYWETA